MNCWCNIGAIKHSEHKCQQPCLKPKRTKKEPSKKRQCVSKPSPEHLSVQESFLRYQWKGHHSQVGVIEGTKCRSVGPQAVGGDQSIRAATVPLARRKDFRIGRSNSRCHLGLKNNVSACTERHTHIRQRASI